MQTESGKQRDISVTEYLTTEKGVTGLPIHGFYSEENRHLSDNLLRFAFCKTDQEIELAKERLFAK